jgi:hypothetical protein
VSDRVVIGAVPANMIELIWPKVEMLIERPILHSNGELCIHEIKKMLIASTMLLLTVQKDEDVLAAIAIERYTFPTGKRVLNITTAGGSELDLWMERILDTCESLAKEHDCEEVYIVGRHGWGRMLKKNGYDVIHTTLSKRVN